MKVKNAYICLSCDEVVERPFGLDDSYLVCSVCGAGPFFPIRNWINAPVEHSDFRDWIKQGFLHHERMIEAFEKALGNYDKLSPEGKNILDLVDDFVFILKHLQEEKLVDYKFNNHRSGFNQILVEIENI